MKRVTLIVILLITGIALTGCNSRYEKVEKEEFSPSPDGKKTIKIENTNGEIKIVKNDEEKIRIIATKKANVRKRDLDKPIEDIRINIIENGSEILVQTELSDSRNGFSLSFKENNKVDYLIFVPARFDVNIDNVSGDIEVTEIEGELNIYLVNGDITLINPAGVVNAELINGNITSEIYSTKGIKMNSVNGKIKMRLSEELNAKIIANITNGRVITDNISFVNSHEEDDSFTGKLGTGEYDIRLESINGRITLENLNDGSPTVSGSGTKEDEYLRMKKEYEEAQEELKQAEENLKKAEEDYLQEKSGTKNTPVDTLKSDSIKIL